MKPLPDEDSGVFHLEDARLRQSRAHSLATMQATPVPLLAIARVGQDIRDRRTSQAPSVVLVVDDDDFQLFEWTKTLAGVAAVAAVATVEEAKKAILERGPFLSVVLDHSLPNGDGLAVLRYLRGSPDGRSTPVHVTSSHTESEALRARYHEANAGGPISFVQKSPEGVEAVRRTLTKPRHRNP